METFASSFETFEFWYILDSLVSTSETILANDDRAIEVGLTFHLLKDILGLISKNI